MKIEKITYKRIKNMGNYESKTFEARAIIEEHDNPDQCFSVLETYVESNLFPENYLRHDVKDEHTIKEATLW